MNCPNKEIVIFSTKPVGKELTRDTLPAMLASTGTHRPTTSQSSKLGPITGFICLVSDPGTHSYMTGVTVGGRLVRVYEL